MKHYVIQIYENEKSVEASNRCINSGKQYGLDIKPFHAFTPKSRPVDIAKAAGIPIQGFQEVYSRFENCLAAFLSHYSLWKTCCEIGTDVTIFEHDAVIINNIPDYINYQGCISLGAPSYGKYFTPSTFGVNSLISKRYFPGAHAYRIKPNAARELINRARIDAGPTDVFLHKDRFPWLEEYYPWPVVAQDEFTTIQNEKGCLAKHRYNPEYKII